MAHVFYWFYRGKERRSAPGFGLWLSIACTLVEAQRGKIELYSIVGKGSEVAVKLGNEIP